jgi:hypothetical protein
MNLLSRSLNILFPPRLPRFGREDVASTAEYYNRLARLHEAIVNPPGVRVGRISTQLAVPILPFGTAEKVLQKILGRAAQPEFWGETWWKKNPGFSYSKRTVVLASPSPSG